MAKADCIEMPSLGRPFQLGMLYDCRSDKLISGVTLWNPDLLKQPKNIDSYSQKSSNCEVIAHDSIENKSNALNIEASLKASFLGGLVSVSGSAKYLNDRKSSKAQARVSLKYSTTSKFAQLTMAHLGLGNIEHQNVFQDGLATHVVTGILYGADAIFVFDKEVGSSENIMKVHGELEAVIKGIPSISIEGRGMVDVGETEDGSKHNFQCTFYGDFRLEENPTTFQEAMNVYRTLPKILGENEEHAVPKKIWLYPLHNLDSKAAKMLREISVSIVNDIQQILETLHEVQLEANQLLKSSILQYFPEMTKYIHRFVDSVNLYKAKFQKSIEPILPRVRGGGAEELELTQVIENHRSSVFGGSKLAEWVELRSREETILAGFVASLDKHASIATVKDICAWSSNLSYNYILAFVFQVEPINDSFIEKMNQYTQNGQLLNESDMRIDSWIKNEKVINNINSMARNFKTFVKTNEKQFTEDLRLKVCTTTQAIKTENDETGADVFLYRSGLCKPYHLPFIPDAPVECRVTHNSVTLAGFLPSIGSNKEITSYVVSYINTQIKGESWIRQEITSQNGTLCVEGLACNTKYAFKIAAKCKLGTTVDGPQSLEIRTKPVPVEERLAIRMRAISTLCEQGPPRVFKLPMNETGHDEAVKLKICEIGQPSFPESPEKVVLMLGATGSGKTTVINGMANFIFGVEWKDDFRFKVVADSDEGSGGPNNQAFSQTKYITSYKFHHQAGFPLHYSVRLIDTPGFGDTEGIKRDEQIVKQIRELFRQRGKMGIDHLDAIGFVVQASNPRLTHTQQYILDSILSVFGKDAIENIFMLITFSDGGSPQILSAIQAANITYKEFFKFNNSALFSENHDLDSDEDFHFDRMFWKIGINSYRAFFIALNTVTSKSLQMTREVLKERERLEASIEGVQNLVLAGLANLDTLAQEESIIRKFESEIEANKEFTYEIDITKQRKIDLCGGEYVTNCLTCNFTCHFPCGIPKNEDKAGCIAMNNGSCTVCPGRCSWKVHVNNSYRFELYQDKETRTSDELRNKYLTAESGKSKILNMVESLRKDFEEIQKGVCAAIINSKNSLNKLNKIAAKSNPLSAVDYIDLLIKSEEMTGAPRFQERIHHLKEAKQKAEFFQSMNAPNYDPWKAYTEQAEAKKGDNKKPCHGEDNKQQKPPAPKSEADPPGSKEKKGRGVTTNAPPTKEPGRGVKAKGAKETLKGKEPDHEKPKPKGATKGGKNSDEKKRKKGATMSPAPALSHAKNDAKDTDGKNKKTTPMPKKGGPTTKAPKGPTTKKGAKVPITKPAKKGPTPKGSKKNMEEPTEPSNSMTTEYPEASTRSGSGF